MEKVRKYKELGCYKYKINMYNKYNIDKKYKKYVDM